MASGGELITKLIGLGVMANQNQAIDFDMVSLLGEELGFNVVGLEEEDEKDEFDLDFEDDQRI